MKRSRNCIGRLDWIVAISLPVLLHGWIAQRYPTHYSVPLFLRCHSSSEGDNDFGGKFSNERKSLIDSNLSRRQVLQSIALTSSLLPLSPDIARAAKAELDATTGNLFTPKGEMWSGGSDAARGIPIARGERVVRTAVPSIYETRFIAYLSRFLLNFDPAARAYWVQQGFGDSWERPGAEDRVAENALAEFAQSVEVGLADYFSGPFGSYASLPAILAGINAAQPAPSKKSNLQKKSRHGFLKDIFSSGPSLYTKSDALASAKQGILNLYTLLKARYNSLAAKRQLAILFSFVSDPDLQPVNEIRSLLGEADNATITAVQLSDPSTDSWDARTSSRHGGGYSYGEPPVISVESPPPLGDQYREAKIEPIMKPTSRVLRIVLTDGGEGYATPPTVTVIQNNGLVIRQCEVTALLDREGHVESIFVLDPGYGYGGGRKVLPPRVVIEAPPVQRSRNTPVRRARAYAQLEYKIAGLQLVDGGTGFVSTEPPNIRISPPAQDPDWYINVQDNPTMRMVPVLDPEPLRAIVTEMKYADGNIAYSINGVPDRSNVINDDLLERIVRDPLELLPSSARPELLPDPRSGTLRYVIPQISSVPQFVAVTSPRYIAEDPIFGGVGRLPVTKGASALTVSEYARLALSGAVCTVAVRTALNPLELIKTKQQLQNDVELMEYARSKVHPPTAVQVPVPLSDSTDLFLSNKEPASDSTTTTTLVAPSHTTTELVTERAPTMVKVGTTDMIRNIVELRGPLALFQSADITFLASLVFGSFGFGATELFRRSFTTTFVSDSSNSSESELVLLLAASLATVLTALAASPFEVLRVRSMGLVTPKPWTDVLKDFLEEKSTSGDQFLEHAEGSEVFDLRKLQFNDILPLWSGFAPILSRELPFAIAKFLTFDFLASTIISFWNSQNTEGSLPIQLGVGPAGLAVSAFAGAFAGIAGAIVSHPADLILTKTSASIGKATVSSDGQADDDSLSPAWVSVVKDLVSQDGGLSNLFVGLGSRSIFFFLVIGLQFFLYDYVKGLFQVSSDDLSLVLDVFYAVRAGLVDTVSSTP